MVTITADNFDKEVLQSDIPVFLDFWATWCGPCRMASPIVEELAAELEGKVKVGKVNVDENIDLAEKYRVASIPMFIVFKNGQVAGKSIGVQPKEALLKLIEG